MTSQIAFATLQASARNHSGLENARALILQAKHIRRQRRLELAEETKYVSREMELIEENPRESDKTSENAEKLAQSELSEFAA